LRIKDPNSAMTSVLSPLAKPFEPSFNMISPEFYIYNNGVPSMVDVDGEWKIIRGVSDEAIEELFPPTVQEIQEMEEVDMFVELLAEMAVLEDREENARSFADIKKRWAARRKDGVPVGGQRRHGSRTPEKMDTEVAGVTMVHHHRVSTQIVPFNANTAKFTHFHGDSQAMSKLKKKNVIKKDSGAFHGRSKPIMQPRQGF